MRRFLALALLLQWVLPPPAAAAGYGDWAMLIVAGDNRAHSGAPSEVFDNARRDLTSQFQRLGFTQANMLEFSVQPEKYPGQTLRKTGPSGIANGLWDLANSAKAGCLIYLTSHGTPDGIVIADKLIAPDKMAVIVGNACGNRPTVVIIAACYSGIFVPALAAPNRMVLTAARSDRPSFGCSEQDKYTYFDTCMLQALPDARDFPGLAQSVELCVAARERQFGVPYASEPQLFIGESVAESLPAFR